MSQLPAGWVFSNLRNIGLPKTLNIDPSKYPDEVFELYSVPSYSQSAPEIVKGSEIRSTKQMVQPGDVLLCKIVPHIVRVWVVPNKSNYRQIASGEWILIRPDSKQVCAEYLRYALTEPRFRAEFMNTVAGVGGSLMRARPKAVAEIPIPLPPIEEQRRIVARLDSLLAQSKAARAELNKAIALAKRQRQAVLAKTISQTNRKQVKISDLGTVRLGRQRSPKNHVGDNMLPYIRAANITWNGLALDDVLEMHFSPQEAKTFQLQPGDILLSEASGSASEVGKPAIWQGEIENCCFQNTVIRVRPNDLRMTKYLFYVFLSYAYNGNFTNASRGIGIHHIGSERLANLTIPLPSLEEQKEIVKRVEAAFAQIETMENEAKKALALAERLEQATLAKAFQGQL